MPNKTVTLRLLSRTQVESLVPGPDELVSVVSAGLAAHGRKEVVQPPKGHLQLDHVMNGHFNILSAWVSPIRRAGIKVIGDYVDNWRHGLPSEIGVLTLYDPATGVPLCIMDATSLTWLRTGAVTCAGAMHLAPANSTVVAQGPGMMDGIEALGDGRFVVSTWTDSSLFVLDGDKITKLVGGLPSAADIAFDAGSGRIAVPLLMENRVEFVDLRP